QRHHDAAGYRLEHGFRVRHLSGHERRSGRTPPESGPRGRRSPVLAATALNKGDQHVHFRLRQRGITLMELMITIMVVGILGAIAIPTYRTYTMKANRSDGKIALTNFAQQLERCYTTTNTYVGCLPLPSPSPQGYYTIDWDIPATVTTYRMKATPV